MAAFLGVGQGQEDMIKDGVESEQARPKAQLLGLKVP